MTNVAWACWHITWLVLPPYVYYAFVLGSARPAHQQGKGTWSESLVLYSLLLFSAVLSPSFHVHACFEAISAQFWTRKVYFWKLQHPWLARVSACQMTLPRNSKGIFELTTRCLHQVYVVQKEVSAYNALQKKTKHDACPCKHAACIYTILQRSMRVHVWFGHMSRSLTYNIFLPKLISKNCRIC